jgi:ribosomal protein S18 acetylase RimI-like enzyme
MQSINKTFETLRGTIIIRESTPADLMQYRDLRLSALLDSPTAFSADYELNLNQPMSFWEGRVKPDEYGKLFFAEYESQLIGMTGIRQGELPKTRHGGYIWGVYVRSEWRGLHIAEVLIETCTNWAETREINIVKLGVMTNNTSAVRCYERCGFTTYGTEPRGILYEGKYYDEYLMSRSLDNS